MSRQPRRASHTGYYHVVTRGNQRATVFQTPEDYRAYGTFLQEAFHRYHLSLAHFCLMPNHVHLLMHAADVSSLSRAMHQLQRRYWFYCKRQVALSGHLWQGRFHSFPIEDEAYLLEAARYIERNPLEAKLVQRLNAYPWSSYRFYAEGHPGTLPLHATPGYDAFGATVTDRQRAYRQFVTTPQPYDRSMRQKLQTVTSDA